MKVKSLFLSMCAIAALASCSKNDDVVATEVEAGEARVILQLKGDGVSTRAVGDAETATESGATVKDITVFFFNKTNFLIGAPQYKSTVSSPLVLTTSTDATQVVVVANLGTDETTTGKFANVRSIGQLKEVVFSSITTSAAPTSTSTVNQTKANLYMSGIGAVTMGNDGAGTATVDLHFLSARINKVAIAWQSGSSNQNYGTKSEFENSTDKWWYIKQVYLMMSQTNSLVLPSGVTKANDNWTGSFAPISGAAPLVFAGGVAWGTSPWLPTPNPQPVQTDGYLVSTIPAVSSTAANKIENVLGTGDALNPWYVFENPSNSTTPTGLIVEIVWRSVANSSNADELLPKYFTLYFGEKKAGSTDTQPYLEPGKTYDVTLNLNGDFTPGGNGGGGSDDPAKPSVDANITVTINAAKWTTVDLVSKDFGN